MAVVASRYAHLFLYIELRTRDTRSRASPVEIQFPHREEASEDQ